MSYRTESTARCSARRPVLALRDSRRAKAPSRPRRRGTASGGAFELLCLFLLGFVVSSFVGVAVAWMLGLHYPEPNPLEEAALSAAPGVYGNA